MNGNNRLIAALRMFIQTGNPKKKIAIFAILLSAIFVLRRRLVKLQSNGKLINKVKLISPRITSSTDNRCNRLVNVAARSSLSVAQLLGLTKEVSETNNKDLLHQWTTIFNLSCPPLISHELLTCTLLLSVLIARTLLSIWIATIHGSVVRSLVDRNFKGFVSRLGVLLLYSFPAAFSNASIEYFEKRLAIKMRERLTWMCLKKYLSGKVFYQMCQLDLRVPHPDHRLTSDIDLWSKNYASLFTTLTKPLLDIIVISRVLLRIMGPIAPLVIISWYALSGILMKLASPDFAKITTTEQKLEAEYRACHTAVVNNSEQIAFYRRLFIGAYDSLLVKYGAFIVGYGVIGLPVFGPNSQAYLQDVDHETSQITQDYVRHSSLLINLAKATGRLVASHKQIQSFIGYSSLISKFINTLNDIQEGRLKTSIIPQTTLKEEHQQLNFTEKGVLIESSNIEFLHVPIITPSNEVLIEDVTFAVARGQHVFLLGPNGSGKTSLFRVLGGLWPCAGGELHRPHPSAIFYIPQRPYMPIGTLRDQLIYPDSINDFCNKGATDEYLEELLVSVQMDHLLIRYSKRRFDTWRYWHDELSGGEKQRIAIGRLCYHQPIFAILDEATSAVSSDVEGRLYRFVQSRGISLITISHRLSLLKYHDHVLKFDGKGNCQFEAIGNHLQHVKSYSSLLGHHSHQSSSGSLTGNLNEPRRTQTTGAGYETTSFANRSASQQFLLLQQSFNQNQRGYEHSIG